MSRLCLLALISIIIGREGASDTIFPDFHHDPRVSETTSERTTTPISLTENTKSVVLNDDSMRDEGNRLEKFLKGIFRSMMKSLVAGMLDSKHRPELSPKCITGLMKYVFDLTKTKVWAVQMFDATSKLPSGLLEGTLGEFGSFDECLEIRVPLRNKSENFRGKYCSIELRPRLPPIQRNYTMPRNFDGNPEDTFSVAYSKVYSNAFYYLFSRLGVCVPSTCSADDVRKLIPEITKTMLKIDVKRCYVDEGIKWHWVHFAVISVIALTGILAIAGTSVEYYAKKCPSKGMNSGIWSVLGAFSVPSNTKKLMSTDQTIGELRVLHGIRALSLAWVILGHIYVWVNISLVRRPVNVMSWFKNFEFGSMLNAWLAVDTFFFLSGFLTSYTCLQVLDKTKGRVNMPLFIIYRYLRLTPALLFTMGLLFCLELLSSGPFWDIFVDPEVESCRNSWWQNLLYISNWKAMNKVCIHPTWYLAADFQLFVVALPVLIMLYRSTLAGLLIMGLLGISCDLLVGTLTYLWELQPAILISSGNTQEIFKVLDLIHMKTFTHGGPYFVGIATGYIILKKKNVIKLSKRQLALGWCMSFIFSFSALYGLHAWSIGYYHGPFVTSLFAAFHRSAFVTGIAWVVFACVTRNGGPVNWILASQRWIPLSRLTFLCYLLHSLVLWIRGGSVRDRHYASHYNVICELFATIVFVLLVSFPCYLLVEAPFSRLLRMSFEKMFATKIKEIKENDGNSTNKEGLETSAANNDIVNSNNDIVNSTNVELTSVKTLRPDKSKFEMYNWKTNRYHEKNNR